MAKIVGGFLRLFQTTLYCIAFCCAAIILGIYSYFLSVLANRNLPISDWKRAVEGISGAAILYAIFAVLLTCFLGGFTFFAFLAVIFDILFVGGFLAMAVLTRDGATSCTGNVQTPLGNGPANSQDPGYGSNGFGLGAGQTVTYAPNLHLACRLNTVAFAVSIIGAFVFVVTVFMQVALSRHQKKEKRFGPSPANNYTSGSGRRRWFSRKRQPRTTMEKDAELGAAGAGAGGLAAEHTHAYRPSAETGITGSTVAGGSLNVAADPYKPDTVAGTHHGAYHTQPTGTSVNPYGYDNTHPMGTASNF